MKKLESTWYNMAGVLTSIALVAGAALASVNALTKGPIEELRIKSEQNAISQVKAFKETVDITGLVLTKLDGTAKGGVVIGIVAENKIPVKFIGVGEQIDDMEIFNSEEFVNAII